MDLTVYNHRGNALSYRRPCLEIDRISWEASHSLAGLNFWAVGDQVLRLNAKQQILAKIEFGSWSQAREIRAEHPGSGSRSAVTYGHADNTLYIPLHLVLTLELFCWSNLMRFPQVFLIINSGENPTEGETSKLKEWVAFYSYFCFYRTPKEKRRKGFKNN